MQKAFITIAFALALTSALADFTAENYVKAPIAVAADNETDFTNSSAGVTIASVTTGDISLIGLNSTENTANSSATSWRVFLKKLDTKSLSAGASSNYTFANTAELGFLNNHAIGLAIETVNNISQIFAYQQPLTGGAALARLTLSSNTNSDWLTLPLGGAVIGKVFYVFYYAADKRVNVTSFTIGGSVGTNEFTLTNAYTNTRLHVAWGEALGSNQLIAMWMEGTTLKDSVVDVNKGTVTPNTIGGYVEGMTCQAYSTDKKWYGEFCSLSNATTGNTTFYVRTNTTSLATFVTYNSTTSTFLNIYPYAQYLAVLFTDRISTEGRTTYHYEIWDLDTFTLNKNRTKFFSHDDRTALTIARVPAGGLYTLQFNPRTEANGTLTGVQVGLLLGSSYLTTIFGFLMTIIAGLLLF